MFKNWGLKSRLIFQTILPTIVVTIFLGCYFTFVRTSDLQDNLISHGELIQTQLVSYAAHSIQANQIDNLNEWIMDAEKDDTVSTITIYKDDGSILAGGDKQVLSRGDIINLKLTTNNTIIKEGRVFVFIDKVKLPIPLGKNFKSNDNTNKKSNLYDLKRNYWAVISISDKHYKDQMFYAILALIIAFACGLLIAILFGLKISQEVARPILAAVKAVNKIKNGNLTATIETPCQGEMLLLKDGINSMASQLRNVHKNMQDNIKKATKELTNTLQEIANKNDQLYEARQDALIASKAKSEFLANMSHEIRTPMNSIIGFTDLLLQTDITKSQKDYLITIEKSSKNLLTIINDILDLSKIEAGSLELHIEEFNLKDTINDVITMLSPQALNKNIDVLLEVEDKIPANIIQDSLRIQQVLTNLLNNAIKFTEKGKVDILVTLLKNEYHNYTIKFEIKDTGIGLTKDELKKLFASFSQADTSTTRNFGGTGLGLVISKNLVEKMSGQIGVESSYKKGSNFWFTIVCQTPIETIKPKHNLNIEQPKATKFIRQSDAKIKPKGETLEVVSVDDNPANLKLIMSILESFGHKVNSFDNGHEAIIYLKNNYEKVDIVFMDLQMPKIDGFNAAKNIYKYLNDKNKEIPIIALTADVFAETKEKIIKTGFHGYQTKPITANHIEQIISQYFTNIKNKNIKSTKKTNVSSDNKKDKKPKKITSSDKQIKVELPIIDMNQALELTGGNEDLIKEMQQMLLEELQSETEKLKSFYEEKNIEKVKFIAHKIQGGASYCGTVRLKEQTKNVERLCYQVQDDTSNKKLQKDLRIAFDSLLDIIQQTSKALEKKSQ